MGEPPSASFYCSRCLTTFQAEAEKCPNLACRRKCPRRGWGKIYAEGEVFDRNYRLHRLLAVGGAGLTYVGRELDAEGEEAGPLLALKVLLAARDQGPYLRRLATEAQILQELDHPNIVQYLGFVHRAGRSPYLITRYEQGGSLLDYLRRVRGMLSIKQTALIGQQICWALQKAHERDIIHRDLKPENVLLTSDLTQGEEPVVRVADFGIAKVHGSLGSNMTRVGAFVGTPHYAAPEQFVGASVTTAADIYSVGAMLMFCMSNKHMIRFADRLDPEESFHLLTQALPPRVDRPDLPPEDVARMDRVLASAMQLDVVKRCNADDLERMLGAICAGRDPEIPVPQAPPPESAPHNISVHGLAGVAEAKKTPELLPFPKAPAPRGERRKVDVAAAAVDAAAAVAALQSREPDEPPAPSPTTPTPEQPAPDQPAPREPPPKRPASRGRSVLGFVVALLAAVAVLVTGTLGGFLAWQAGVFDELLTPEAPPIAVEEELDEAEDTHEKQADYAAISDSLNRLADEVGQNCAVRSGSEVRVQLVIDGAGLVHRVNSLSGRETGICVADAIVGKTLERTRSPVVRTKVALTW